MTQREHILTHEEAKALRDSTCMNDPLALIYATERAVLARQAALAQKEAQPIDFDTWSAHPYTKVLEKSIAEDYVPKEAQPEPIKPIRTQTIISPAGVETITATYQLFTPRHRALLEQALEALDLSRDDVSECLCNAQALTGYERHDRRIKAYQEQLEKHDAAIAAIREELGEK